MKKLQNKVAVVTGATSGIGAACAREFAAQGAAVAVVGRNEERGEQVAEDIRANHGTASFVQCDVTEEGAVRRMVQSVAGRYGQIDILFNNAGTMLPSVEIERLDPKEWKGTFDININSCFLVSKYAKEYLCASHGVILNNASIAGLQYYAAGRSYAYSASKAAVIQFSHMMAKNYAQEGVRVNCICPGIILTPILHGRDPKIYEERIPLGYVGTPEDVAKAALFLVSEDSSYITGAVIPVDGGASL